MKNPFIPGKALIIVRQTCGRTSFMFLPLRNTRLLQRLDTAQRSSGHKGTISEIPSRDKSWAHQSPVPEAAHPPSLLRTPQKPSCLFFSLNSTIKMDQMSSPIFWVCTPRHERGQSEQSASWVPIPAPAGTWLGLSLGSYTKQGFWHFLAEPKCLFFFLPKKCLRHNSACLYKEDRQNCLEMEAKPDSPKLMSKFYNMNTWKWLGLVLVIFACKVFFFSFLFRTVFPYKSILLKALLPWSSPPTATVTNLW